MLVGDSTALRAYAFDGVTRQLTRLAADAGALGSAPLSLVRLPSAPVVYAYNGDDVNVFSLGAGGALTLSSRFSTLSTGHTYGRFALHPSHQFAYFTGDCAATRNTYMTTVDAGSGALTALIGPTSDNCTGTVGTPDGLYVSNDGSTLLVAGTALEVSSIDGTGVATPVRAVSATGSRLFDVAVSHDERTVVAAGINNKAEVFSTDGGLSNLASIQSRAGPMGASDVTVHPTLDVFYMVGSTEAAVVIYTRQSNGTLVESERTRLQAAGRDVVVSRDGQFLWVVSPSANVVSTLALDSAGLPVGVPVTSTVEGVGPTALLEVQ